jgi:hypothetical protein
MRITIWWLCVTFWAVAAFLFPSNISGQQKNVKPWYPGTYRGLVTGRATTKDVVRILGLPSWQGKPQEVTDVLGEEEWSYAIATPQGECCDLFFKSGVLKSITLRLESVQANEAEKLFGPGFNRVQFRTEDDRSETGSAPICEDPKGNITMLLNPRMGLSLSVGDNGVVLEATYGDTQPGSRNCDTKKSRPPK